MSPPRKKAAARVKAGYKSVAAKRNAAQADRQAARATQVSQLGRDMLLCAMSIHGVMFGEQDTREFVRRARTFYDEVEWPTRRPAEKPLPAPEGEEEEGAEILADETIE